MIASMMEKETCPVYDISKGEDNGRGTTISDKKRAFFRDGIFLEDDFENENQNCIIEKGKMDEKMKLFGKCLKD